MPVSADTTQYGIVKETIYGVTPTTPVFQLLPLTSDSLVAGANTALSQTLNPLRQTEDSFLNSIDVAGSLDFEFAKTPAMTILLESSMGKALATDASGNESLIVSNEQISYTVEKRWPDPATPGSFLYHRYKGCVSNTLSLSMSAGDTVTGSVGAIGKELVTDTAIITGATYVTATSFEVFRGPDVSQIILDNAGGTLAPTISDACVTDITINLNNQYRGILCLGTLGNKEVVIGTLQCDYDQSIFFSHNSIMDNFLAQNILNEIVTIGDVTKANHYTFTTTRGKFDSNEVVAGGTGADVVNSNKINWLIDNDLGAPTTLEITSFDADL
jgi:hypothetical protein